MADPRFFHNRGPISAASLAAHLGIDAPADGERLIHDVAGLAEAGPQHLSFLEGHRARDDFARTKAGWCLVSRKVEHRDGGPALLRCESVQHAFAKAVALFYPVHGLGIAAQDKAIHPSARLGTDVVVGFGAVIRANAEIGDGTRIGPGAVIDQGVTIGTNCEIGAGAYIGFAHVGDSVRIMPGARIGGPGFGFASDARGHTPIPQVGRVIVQDRVEIGTNSTVDRGALSDTVIGEGTKIDNLVQIGHNSILGRHCILAGNAGVAGSARLGDFVIVGGSSGIGDHAVVGDHARIAAMSGVWGELAGGQDYGGMKARPVREWQREMLLLSKLAKERKRPNDE